ncbi:MAG: hypothetical protein U0822_16335 [Anaerolineae bacterium]
MRHSSVVKWLLLLAGAALAVLIFGSTQAHAQSCQYQLGFLNIYNQIPEIVGACVTNEVYDANGNSNQMTANGMLQWRKADNFTAFTDGYRTWVNGPCGLEMRLNTQRFPFEANPEQLPYVPSGCPAGNVMAPPAPVPPPVPPPTTAPAPGATPEASINFWADSQTVTKGECTTVHWDVQYIDRVYFEGDGVTGQGSKEVCPEQATTYTLEVVHYGGSTTNHQVTVKVEEP